MLKYLLTQREKGGWWSSLIDGPGAQAALHRTTAVQSGKFMEFKEMRILSQNLHTSSCYISSNLKAMLKHRDSQHLGVTCSPQPCRGGTWLQSAQLSHTCWTRCRACTPRSGCNTSLTHPKQGMWHKYLLSQQMVPPEGNKHQGLMPPSNAPTAGEWQTQLSHWYWGTINAGQSPILTALSPLVCTKWVLLAAMKYWALKSWIHFHKNLMMGFQVMMAVPATSFVSHPLGHCTAQSILCKAPIK